MKFWYISFCADDFLGGIHIWATSGDKACRIASEMGENPGGEALAIEVSLEIAKRIPERYVNRLLTKDEIAEAMRLTFPDDPEAAELLSVDSHGNRVPEQR